MQMYTSPGRFPVVCVLLLVSLFSFTSLYAQGTGKMKGRVLDNATGEPLIGANIVIQNTGMGASTDMNGEYFIPAIPAGTWTARISYLGYATVTRDIVIAADATLEQVFRLKAEALQGQEVVVTAQARGQNEAINKQLSSGNVVNVVSAARIQELPDANAAESIGRLPGVSLVRSGGQATQVVIRGLQPQYNTVTIDGVAIPSNDAGSITTSGIYSSPANTVGGRAVDLSMISSNSLEGIEVFKTVLPDMDAAVLGGTVNFGLREARGNPSGAPSVSLLAQGGYNDLASTYNDYKFVLSGEQRFFDDRLGIFVQGIAQKQNLLSNQLGASYSVVDKQVYPDSVILGSLYLAFSPTEQKRYDGTLTLDYRLPEGKIALVNLISYGTSTSESHSETYNLSTPGQGSSPNEIDFGTQLSSNNLHVMTNILEYEQDLGVFKAYAKFSNAYSDNRTPVGWRLFFDQLSAGTVSIPENWNPVQIAGIAQDSIKLGKMNWAGNSSWSGFNKQDDTQGSIDLERNVTLSDLFSVTVKAGGQYRYTTRYNNFDDGFGNLLGNNNTGFRQQLIAALPWLAQPPYNLNATGTQNFGIGGFYNPNMNFGKFLKGDYGMFSAVNAGTIDQIMNEIRILGAAITQPQTVPSYVPDQYGSTASDYSGHEFRSAEYLMATVNIGSQVTVIPGVRYQGLKTTYTAAHFIGNADATSPYPFELNHTWVTQDEYHGYWLPDISVKYNPLEWLSLRAAYTSTISYPGFGQIIPREDVASNSGHYVIWNNYALRPAQSHNYDFQVAVHENTLGLFAVSPFLKRIDDQIFHDSTFIADPSVYPGIPPNTRTFSLSTYINNPNRVDVWGIETEWQTHFWYLPEPLNGLVLNVNYTHIFSRGKYPYNLSVQSPVYPYPTTHVDTTYTDRLIQQPNDIVNMSIGFDYGQFSVLASMIYQSQVYNGTDFFNALRSDETKYLRWDLSAKQGLPWAGLEVYADVNNINSEPDLNTIRGSGFPVSESHYGLTADLGIRWRLE